MPTRLALELTNTEARALLAAGSESRVKIQKFVSIPFDSATGEDAAAPSPEQALVEALAENAISRVDTILVVGRADVELRLLSVPNAPATELPEMVRFQAMQEMPGIGEKTPLDFLPLGTAEPEGDIQRVLAAVLKPRVMDRLERICEEAKLTPISMVLRPTAGASLALRENPQLRDGCTLLVEVLGRKVDFAALRNGRVVFLRHMLLAGDPKESDEAAENLVAEIRRTRIAVANQENVESVEPVALMGNRSDHERLAKRIADETGATTLLIDPLPGSTVADSTAVPAAEAEACAALLGAVLDEAGQRPHAYDFLHPRKAPPPPSRRNRFAAAGLTVACLVLAIILLNWWQGSRLQAEINDLKQQAKELEPQVQKADKLIADAGEVSAWLDSEVVWLDELAWLSERFPKAEDAMLTTLSATSNAQRREIRLTGYARSVTTVSDLDGGLRDAGHQVIGKTRNENRSESGYDIQFRSSVQISPTEGKRTDSRRETPQGTASEGEKS